MAKAKDGVQLFVNEVARPISTVNNLFHTTHLYKFQFYPPFFLPTQIMITSITPRPRFVLEVAPPQLIVVVRRPLMVVLATINEDENLV